MKASSANEEADGGACPRGTRSPSWEHNPGGRTVPRRSPGSGREGGDPRRDEVAVLVVDAADEEVTQVAGGLLALGPLGAEDAVTAAAPGAALVALDVGPDRPLEPARRTLLDRRLHGALRVFS